MTEKISKSYLLPYIRHKCHKCHCIRRMARNRRQEIIDVVIEFIKIEPHPIDEKHISTERCYLLFPRMFEIENTD
jgi:hypothetical protein